VIIFFESGSGFRFAILVFASAERKQSRIFMFQKVQNTLLVTVALHFQQNSANRYVSSYNSSDIFCLEKLVLLKGSKKVEIINYLSDPKTFM
jgi:hypothetical protein